jgi:uncharacterized protein YceK
MKTAMVLMLSISVLLYGCATVFKGNKSEVGLTSAPEGAKIIVDGAERGITPATLSLDSGKNYQIRFVKDGYQETAVYVQGSVEAVWVVLDIVPGILLGFIPVLVDAITGAWSDLEPAAVSVTLAPVVSGQ